MLVKTEQMAEAPRGISHVILSPGDECEQLVPSGESDMTVRDGPLDGNDRGSMVMATATLLWRGVVMVTGQWLGLKVWPVLRDWPRFVSQV